MSARSAAAATVRDVWQNTGSGAYRTSKNRARQLEKYLDNHALRFDNGLVLNKSRFPLADHCLSELGGGFFI
jgi:hypothetical protein